MASPLDLPRRLAASVTGSIDAAGGLPAFREELLDRARSMDEGISTLQQTIGPMREDMSMLAARSERLEDEISEVKRLLADITEHIPDPDGSGPVAKARQALTGGE